MHKSQYFPKHKYESVINNVAISPIKLSIYCLKPVECAQQANGLEYVILKQATIWLFLGCEVFNISRFLMDGCLKGADDKFALASRNPEIGTKTRYSKHWKIVKLYESPLEQVCLKHGLSAVDTNWNITVSTANQPADINCNNSLW